MARIGIGIEEPTQNPPPEVTHILKKIGLQPDATIEDVRLAMQNSDNFAALGQLEPIILARHFGEPIEARDDMKVGSKLDGVSDSVGDQILAIQHAAFQKLRGIRRAQLPDGGAKGDLLAKKLRAMDIAADLEEEKRKALIARFAAKLSGPNIPVSSPPPFHERKGLLSPEEIRQRLLDNLRQ